MQPLVHQPAWEGIQEAIEEVHSDEKLLAIIDALRQGRESKPAFTYKKGTLFYEGRLVLSSTSSWIPKMLKEFHETPQGGHSGYYRTYGRLVVNLFWIGMKRMVQQFVMGCDIGLQRKYLAAAPGGLLQPSNIPE